MKVFISWSGTASRDCALALKKAIQSVFNGVEPWMSAEDIKPGQQWFTELMNVLGETRFAIVCLTRSNMRAPWVMFEAGAVSATAFAAGRTRERGDTGSWNSCSGRPAFHR